MSAQAIFTQRYREKYGDIAAGVNPTYDLLLATFNVGEAGFVTVGPDKFPEAPSIWGGVGSNNTLQSDDVTANRLNAVTGKAIGGANISHDGAGKVTIVCKLAANEAELDGQGIVNGGGSDSHLFEIAVFDTDGDMMVYGTFDEEIKLAGKAIDLTVVVTY